MKSALTQISNSYERLSYSERIFANYVLNNREKIIHMPIADVSEQIGIAPSTVIAAIKKLGFEGYREFKIALASEQLNAVGDWSSNFEKLQKASGIYQRVVSSNIAALQESLNTIKDSQLKEAGIRILNAQHIYIFGVGTSGVLAREAHDFFFRLGLSSTFHEDLHYQLLAATRLTDRDIAVLISQTGVNKDIIKIAEQLKDACCQTIGISNYMGTPFAKYVDLLLAPLTMLSTTHDNHFSFRVPILCIIEALYYILSEQMGEQYQSALKANYHLVENNSVNK
ncbi:MAG: MurR/RpiR family transcriptional regulator [Lachnospiraceae bacterium]|jgi:RpiR family carbohydrate utilization transcriptional regulator